jgi:hypothetical protein
LPTGATGATSASATGAIGATSATGAGATGAMGAALPQPSLRASWRFGLDLRNDAGWRRHFKDQNILRFRWNKENSRVKKTLEFRKS